MSNHSNKIITYKKMLARKDCTIDENTKPSKGGHNPTTPMHMIIKSEDLNLGAKLGEGAFGAVYTATLLQDEILVRFVYNFCVDTTVTVK